jgi:hypothetical protein
MSRLKHMPKCEVGEARPSQMLTTYGVGSIVDLPNMSALVMGLADCPQSGDWGRATVADGSGHSGCAGAEFSDAAADRGFGGSGTELAGCIAADWCAGGTLSSLDGVYSLSSAGPDQFGVV